MYEERMHKMKKLKKQILKKAQKKALGMLMAVTMLFSSVEITTVAAEAYIPQTHEAEYGLESPDGTTDGAPAAFRKTADMIKDGYISYSATYINPIYASVIKEEDLISAGNLEGPKAELYASEELQACSSIEEAGVQLREQLKKRTGDIEISYETQDEVQETIIAEIFDRAIQHTGNATEGDYIRFQFAGYKADMSGYKADNTNYLTIKYAVTYYTTEEQEQLVDAKIRQILEELNLDGKSDYHKIKSVYDYVCANVTYDHDNLNDDAYVLKYSAYAALINKTAVCQGYANSIYRLLLESGVDSRIIDGIGNGGAHAWNIAQAGTLYYNLDATWDAGQNAYSCFLRGADNFSDHQANDEYLSETFRSRYVISDEDAVEPGEGDSGTGDGSDEGETKVTDTWQNHAAEVFSGGSGTKEDPYQIGSAEELALLAKKVNDGESSYQKAFYILTNDIDLRFYEWMPIGYGTLGNDEITSISTAFYGTFDGDNHTIRNLHIRNLRMGDKREVYFYGLFGLTFGNIRNVVLENVDILVESVDEGWVSSNGMVSQQYAGGLTGVLYSWGNGVEERTQIENCKVDADIKMYTQMSVSCGTVVGSAIRANLINTQATGNLVVAAKRALQAGGFAGNLSWATVEDCSFEGTVSSTNDGIITEVEDKDEEGYYYLHYVGGFTSGLEGSNDIVMKRCRAKAKVTGSSERTVNAGGFIGTIGIIHGTAHFQDLYCDATVTVSDINGESKSRDFVGGGYIAIWEDCTDDAIVESCYSKGEYDGDIYVTQGVTDIGESIFENNNKLIRISIPMSVTNIGDSAFNGCGSLTDVYYGSDEAAWLQIKIGINNESLTNAVIHYNTTEIPETETPGTEEFEGTDGNFTYLIRNGKAYLTAYTGDEELVIVPSAFKEYPLEAVCRKAFNNSKKLKSITFSEGLVSMEAKSISACPNLESVSLPASFVLSDDININEMIYGCEKLSSISVSEDHAKLSTAGGVLYTKAMDGLLFYPPAAGGVTFRIPDSVSYIGESAFYGAGNIKELVFPEGIKSIGNYAFSSCSHLETINLPDGIELIGDYAFYGCSSIKVVNYGGSDEQWSKIAIGIGNECLTAARNGLYSVVFHGTDIAPLTGIRKGSKIEAPTPPVLSGYLFTGWYKDAECTVLWDFDTDTVQSDLVLYPGWKPETEPDDPDKPVDPDNPDIPNGFWMTEVPAQTYTGKAIKPAVQVYDGATLLTEKVDYSISYKNTTKANNAENARTAPTITVTGKGSYSGKETVTFAINQRDMNDTDEDGNYLVSAGELIAAASGKVQKPVPVLIYNGKKLANKRDFTVSYPDEGEPNAYKAAGTYRVKVTGIGNYTGERMIEFTVTDKTLLTKAKISAISAQAYTGQAVEPEIKVTFGKNVLIQDTHYTVSYRNNTQIGKATVTITGIGEYAGSKSATFQIKGESIAKAVITGLEDKVYNGEAQTQENLQVALGGKVLTRETDYTVAYTKETNAGTATVIVTGTGGYSGKVKKTFKIAPYDLTADKGAFISGIPRDLTVPYTKGGCAPAVSPVFDGTDMAVKRDYTITYANNKKVASAADAKPPLITIKGRGNFKGAILIPFNIVQSSFDEGLVSIFAADVAYVNKAGKYISKPVLTDSNGKKLTAGTDYEKNIAYTLTDGTKLDGKSIVPEGETVLVTVTGKGAYRGTLTASYHITKVSFGKARITVAQQSFTGSAVTLKPEDITVKIGSNTLVYGRDFTIDPDSYRNNVKKGTASVTIKGMGDYGGTKTVKFKITAKKITWYWRGRLLFGAAGDFC